MDTGELPQNFIRDTGNCFFSVSLASKCLRCFHLSAFSSSTGLKNRFEEYPKLRELIQLKDELISARATPPMYLRTDLLNYDLRELNSMFDVILVEPPLEEYNKVTGAINDRFWSWSEVSFKYLPS